MTYRSTLLIALGCFLVLVSLYTFGGVIQAASLFRGVRALRNANLWGSLSLVSLALAVMCFSRARRSAVLTPRLARPLRTAWGCVELLLAGWLLWPLFSDIFSADRCLDSGGSFDYVRSVCDMSETHPYVPLLDRQGFRVVGALVFGVSALVALRSNFSSSGRAEARRST
jgi:hypothetical protein